MIHTEDIQVGMEVIDTSEKHVGVVQSVEGDDIKLTDDDPEKGVLHRSIPVACVAWVGKFVRLDKSCEELRRAWHVAEPPIRHPLAQEAEHGPGTL